MRSGSGVVPLLVVCLALVLSPAAAGGGSAGAAGASTAVDGHDATLHSGETFWKGWRLFFDGTRIVSDPASAPERQRTFQVRRVEDGRVTELVTEFAVDGDGEAALAVGASGSFVIQYKGDTVYVDGGVGRTARPDGEVTVANSAWSIEPQTLSTSWSDGTAYNGQVTHLRLESNRDRYVVAVSVANRSFADLTSMFRRSAYAPNYDARADGNTILLEAGADTDFRVSVEGFEPGEHTFEVNVVDTTATARPVLTVASPSKGVRFESVERGETVGDVVETRIACKRCYLVIGDETQGLIELLELRDESGDGSVNLRINTRYAGLDSGAPGAPGDVSAYTAGKDSVRVLRASARLDSGTTLGDIRSDLFVPTRGRTRPLGPGDYHLRLATSTHLMDLPPDTGGHLVVRDETDARTVVLRDRSLGGIQVFTAPPGSAARTSLEDISAATVDRSVVAMDDRLVVRVDASGLYGYLNAVEGDRLAALVDNRDEGMDLTLESVVSGIGNPNTVRFDRTEASLLLDPDGDRFFVVIDTRNIFADRPVETGDRFDVRFVLSGVDGSRPAYSIEDPRANYRGYPYLAPGASERVDTTIRFVEQSASVLRGASGRVEVASRRSADVVGNTTVAPGSTLVVRAAATGEGAWVKQATVTVRPDGTWQTALDFSNTKPGQRFDLTVSRGGKTLAETEGVVVDPETPTPDPASSGPTPNGSAGNASTATPGSGSDGGGGDDSSGGDGDGSGDGGGFLPDPSDLPLVPALAAAVVLILLGVLGRIALRVLR